jgi:hypothetical protein
VLDRRSITHRLEGRIRARVPLCWLAQLLIRAENQTRQTWPAMRRELQRNIIGTFTGPVGTLRQRTDIPNGQRPHHPRHLRSRQYPRHRPALAGLASLLPAGTGGSRTR